MVTSFHAKPSKVTSSLITRSWTQNLYTAHEVYFAEDILDFINLSVKESYLDRDTSLYFH